MSWNSSPGMSPNRPQRSRKRNKLIYYGDDDVSSEEEVRMQKRRALKLLESPLAAEQSPSSSVENVAVASLPVPTFAPSTPETPSGASTSSNIAQSSVADRTIAKKIGFRLKNLLKLPKAHKMCIYEWFYSHIDKCLFEGDNDFLLCLKESFPTLSTKGLTRAHWAKIRRIMGKPRRCSEAFFMEERNSLKSKRFRIRQLQQRKVSADDGFTFNDLPKEIPMSLILGTKVTARLRGSHDGLYTGRIDAVDVLNSSYRVTFDRRNLGTKEVSDIEVASDDPQETMQLTSLIDRKRPFYNMFSPMQPDFNDSLQSPTNEHDPVLGQSPLRSKFPGGTGGTLGGFPVKFLVQVARLSKILAIKKENLQLLEQMNSQAEKSHSYGETLPIEFQRKYATVVLELERLNAELNSLLLGIQKFCLELSPENTILCDQGSHVRQTAMENAEQMVESKNLTTNGKKAVKNCGLTTLVKQLTAIMMQIRYLKENNGNPFEFKAITDSMDNIKEKIMPENMESFQNNVEIHIAHIQSGMNRIRK
uniref:protein lin-9 homolog n=1 Tax=Styela clava TaxID=7725 RepID=UPI001939DA94|nr:protein lin-9 homolog [Styela clava]